MLVAQRPEWDGRTVACIASGPSLTREDCDRVRSAGVPTVVTNSTFRLAPWADVLFGFDSKWWLTKNDQGVPVIEEVKVVFGGRLMTASQVLGRQGVESTFGALWFSHYGNSGASAILLAIGAGARRVVLLGFDCQRTGGAAHWHGDHPAGLSNCASMRRWPKQFARVAAIARSKKVEVVNASRETALDCFERRDLEAALA